MALSVLSLPKICISPAPPLEPFLEPSSPFGEPPFLSDEEEYGLRSTLLTPPPSLSKHLSPLCPPEVPLKGRGLERERFEMLLKASRQRSTVLGIKRSPDLRKELALKAHQNKQVERRARFLCKIKELQSPFATTTPKIPLDSPAPFHYSLPSPGLISPIAMYGQLEGGCATSQPWIEQVDFYLPAKPTPPVENAQTILSSRSTGKGLPSLDQISARLTMKQMSGAHDLTSVRRLPLCMQQKLQPCASQQPQRNILTIGRLQMPGTRSRSPSPPPSQVQVKTIFAATPSPKTPELQVTTTMVPRTMPSKQNPTESNLGALSRENMLKALRRRSQACHQSLAQEKHDIPERNTRRLSSPGELPKLERMDFRHQVLNLRGAF